MGDPIPTGAIATLSGSSPFRIRSAASAARRLASPTGMRRPPTIPRPISVSNRPKMGKFEAA